MSSSSLAPVRSNAGFSYIVVLLSLCVLWSFIIRNEHKFLSKRIETLLSKKSEVTPRPSHLEAIMMSPDLDINQAVELYREKVQQSKKKKIRCRSKGTSNVSCGHAISCLEKTMEDLKLQYPEDADDHFNDIRIVMANWSQHALHRMHEYAGYSGPWIENRWISLFEDRYDTDPSDTCLTDHFGPYIPIFLPWCDHYVSGTLNYTLFFDSLLSVLRPSVPYITVSQHDTSLFVDGFFDVRSIPNLLILNQGGYGHVPIPMILREEDLRNQLELREREFDVSYVGSLDHAPGDMRQQMHRIMLAQSNESVAYKYHQGEEWRSIMANSRFSLVPRGYGRTAFHLAETIQMGLIPVYVYLDLDIPWLPYGDLIYKIGFVTMIGSLSNVISQLSKLTFDEIKEREHHAESVRNSHFSYNGVLNQIDMFLKGKESDLQCQKLPRYPR